MAIYAPPIGLDAMVQATLQTLREAAQAHRKVNVKYRDASNRLTMRILRPLGCFYWGKVWTLAAWCEVRNGFRSFRLDRIESVLQIDGKDGHFNDEPGKRLTDYLRSTAPAGVQEKLDGTS
jgi:predicted DNA-binding transcriptional regulator YafY